jgi:high-affinity Fe2+/Pb2+ permease
LSGKGYFGQWQPDGGGDDPGIAPVALRYVDEANLSNASKWLVRGSIPIAAILVPAAFFLSVLSPDATAPNGLIYLAYVGAVLLAVGVLVLGVGLVRRPA